MKLKKINKYGNYTLVFAIAFVLGFYINATLRHAEVKRIKAKYIKAETRYVDAVGQLDSLKIEYETHIEKLKSKKQ